MSRVAILSFLILTVLTGCLDPYQPSEILTDVNILVVDGFVNTTDNSAVVKLSYASSLSSETTGAPESGASVDIEEEGGDRFNLIETEPGHYTLSNIATDQTKRYRLNINTSSGKTYFSDYATLTTTPEIDDVTWKSDDKGITIFASTHDPAENSGYYYWTYQETWEYNSSFNSTYKLIDGEGYQRFDQIYTCWTTTASTDILVGSTSRLSNDVIRDFPIAFVTGSSVKLSRRYSILVQQRTITKDAYDFWSQLQKTTESLGGLFDPQPTQVLGNIHSSEDGEPVLGYFSGGEVTEKRLFVRMQDLPEVLLRQRLPPLCTEDDVETISVADLRTRPNTTLLIDPIYVQGIGIVAYTSARPACIDCQVHGGTTQKPDFW